jgi:hypothetical protein
VLYQRTKFNVAVATGLRNLEVGNEFLLFGGVVDDLQIESDRALGHELGVVDNSGCLHGALLRKIDKR